MLNLSDAWKIPLLGFMLAVARADDVQVDGSAVGRANYKEPNTNSLGFVSTFQESGLDSWVKTTNSKYDNSAVSLANCGVKGMEDDMGLLLGPSH
ncbi:unnamed protein product, partial [Discosporangium mesarthrocarpum]